MTDAEDVQRYEKVVDRAFRRDYRRALTRAMLWGPVLWGPLRIGWLLIVALVAVVVWSTLSSEAILIGESEIVISIVPLLAPIVAAVLVLAIMGATTHRLVAATFPIGRLVAVTFRADSVETESAAFTGTFRLQGARIWRDRDGYVGIVPRSRLWLLLFPSELTPPDLLERSAVS